MFKRLVRLPIGVIFLVLCLPLGLGVLAKTSHPVHSWLRWIEGAPLQGMQTAPPHPQLNWQTFITGTFQKQVEAWFNDRLPLRQLVVRATNQFYYSTFSKSYMYHDTVIVGKREQLYEMVYLAKYCSDTRQIARPNDSGKWTKIVLSPTTSRDFDLWIRDLKEIGAFFEKRGQTFVYLITPSKAAYYPEDIPQGFRCASVETRRDYHLAIAALQNSGLNYVDGSKTVLDLKGTYPAEMFPHTGTHWTLHAAALVSRELVAKISQVRGRSLPLPQFSYRIEKQTPTGSDIDLLNLLNLWQPVQPVPVSTLTFKKFPQPTTRLAVVGGSFIHQMMEVLDRSGTFCQMDYYYYFKLDHFRYFPISYPNGRACQGVPNPSKPYQELLSAQVVVVEENEANLRSRHVELLKAALLKKNH
jgi:alginate O-acetyltransferase complex protein AlgJ